VAQVQNRPAFIMLASKKSKATCAKCGTTGGWHGRTLHWYAKDGTPAPLLAAHQGVDAAVIATTLPFHDLLCPKCARKRGAKFTRAGTPAVKLYLVAG
jgi:hypothetical protein